MPNPEYIVDVIFPAEELHLIAGPSGAGKSTWMYQFIEEWLAGRRIYGYDSHPTPWMIVSCDRSAASMHRTLARMGCKLDPKRIISLVDKEKVDAVTLEVLIGKALPDGGTVFIEGFAALANGNQYKDVAKLCIQATSLCKKYHVTIFATMHSPKTKENEAYANPRQRIAGSVAWAGFSETVVLVEPPEGKDDGTRSLIILPRNAKAMEFDLQFNQDGRLVELTSDLDGQVLDAYFLRMPAQTEIITEEVVIHASLNKISKRTAERWLREKVDAGELKKLTRGRYIVPHKQ